MRSPWAGSFPVHGLLFFYSFLYPFYFFFLIPIFSQKSQGLLKLKLYDKLFRLNAIRLITFLK